MEVKGEYRFDAPREVVWGYLQDPQVLVKVLPGCEDLKSIGENEYQGALKVKIGPVQGTFQGTVKMTDIVAPEAYRMQVDGRGAPGFAAGAGGLRLEAQGDTTLMIYQGEALIGGRIASVGQRLIDSSAKAIIKQSLVALNGVILAGMAAQAAPAAEPVAPSTVSAPAGASAAVSRPSPIIPPTYTPPSQSQLAFKVAANMAQDLIPQHYQPLLAGAAGGALVLLLYLLVRYLVSGAIG